MNVYNEVEPIGKTVPIIISSPHSGIAFPDDLKGYYKPDLIAKPDDTDWFIHQLYDFAPELGIKLISAKYSRWVIDLNRDPESKPLYSDGRIITELCPTSNFLGQSIYNNDYVLSSAEIERRLAEYYWPYYQKIEKEISRLKSEFGYVIFWDAHSIKEEVPTIRKEKFPALILGDNDGKSANNKLSEVVISQLERKGYAIKHNDPFKGGHLTRYFGQPAKAQHALQLEMTKVNYMDNSETEYHKGRAGKMREALYNVFEALIETGKSFNEKV